MDPRVAIIGSGPSAYFTAEELLKADVAVDIIERLPTPFGLVRSGVAPDHPKIKSIAERFHRVSSHPNLRFYGNVEAGRTVTIPELLTLYHGVVLACGAPAEASLGIPGEDLPGSCSAGAFVAWYNGHPDYRDCSFPFDSEAAAIVGHGNVALDVARILLTPVDRLRATEIAEHALEALSQSAVTRVHVIGRRGPAQSGFTPFELKEIINLEGCRTCVDPNDLVLDQACQTELTNPKAASRRQNVDLFREVAGRNIPAVGKDLHFEFRLTPVAILGSEGIKGLRCVRNRLEGEPGSRTAESTEKSVTIECRFLIRSIGFRGTPIADVPFDAKRGTVPSRAGRVTKGDQIMPGLYVVGWLKRGSNGVIGTNRACGAETARAIIDDLRHHDISATSNPGLEDLLHGRGIEFLRYDGWLRIDVLERKNGLCKGKPREKFTRMHELLNASHDVAG